MYTNLEYISDQEYSTFIEDQPELLKLDVLHPTRMLDDDQVGKPHIELNGHSPPSNQPT